MKKIHLFILTALLSACSDSETPTAVNAPPPDFRQVFIQSCVESASGSPLPKDKIGELCACTYDQTAASYGSNAQWQQAMNDYENKRSNPAELENRMRQAAAQCQQTLQVAPAENASAASQAHHTGTQP